MNSNEIYKKVVQCVVDSCDVSIENITPEKTLITDLGMDSIDLVDLLFQLENTFSINIPISEIENMARTELAEKPFDMDTIITSEGLECLKKLMPEVPSKEFKKGLTVQRIPFLFTVQSISNLVHKKLNKKTVEG